MRELESTIHAADHPPAPRRDLPQRIAEIEAKVAEGRIPRRR